MGRRNDNILDDLVNCPWWVSVAVSAIAFIALRAVLPSQSGVALLAAFVLLIPAPIAAYRQWRERGLLDKQEGLGSIRALSWARFETLVAEAYRRQGYAVSRVSGNGPDGGVDLVLRKDGNTVLVQCKQWKAWKVGVHPSAI